MQLPFSSVGLRRTQRRYEKCLEKASSVCCCFFFFFFFQKKIAHYIPLLRAVWASCSRGHCHANQLEFKTRDASGNLSPRWGSFCCASLQPTCVSPLLPSSRLLNLKLPFSPLPTYGTCAAAATASSSSYIPGVEALHAEAINIGCTYGDQAQQMAPGEAQSLPTVFYI